MAARAELAETADDEGDAQSRKGRRRAKRKRRGKAQAPAVAQPAVAKADDVGAGPDAAPVSSAQAKPESEPVAVTEQPTVETEQPTVEAVSVRTEAEDLASSAVVETAVAAVEPVRKVQKVMPVPVLRIDDARPDAADEERELRVTREREDATWKTFLPPALLDSEEGSRRGALTLAVIILVIVATLAMSYLLRRPSDSGDGVTRLDRVHLPSGALAQADEPGSRPGSSV